jgi:hypothetical protein
MLGLKLINFTTAQFSIPPSIGDFVNLQTVTISNCLNLVGSIPVCFVLLFPSSPFHALDYDWEADDCVRPYNQ